MSERRSILLLCDENRTSAANVLEHIEAIERFSEHNVYRFNPVDRADASRLLDLGEFDAVVLHYTIALTSARYLPPPLPERLGVFRGLKVQFIQDEYRAIDAVTTSMRSLGIDVLFTCVPEPASTQVYAKRLPGVRRITTLPGYVPDELVGREVPPTAQRSIDVGYRGRDVPAWLGRLGREKTEIAQGFLERTAGEGLRCDISSREEDRIYGEAWNRFLASCRATLGTESGASIVDFDGSLEALGKDYVARHPNATRDAIERDLTGPYEGNVVINTASPRIFEAAALRTAMILFRGAYGGVVEPGVHYVPLEKDFSNIDEVVARVRDVEYLGELAARAYNDLVASGRYSLRSMVRELDEVIAQESKGVGGSSKESWHRAQRRRRMPPLGGPSRLRIAIGRLIAPPAGLTLAIADPELRHLLRANPGRRGLSRDLRRLTALRRGLANSRFHVFAELVPDERLLFLSSRPDAPEAGPDIRREVAHALGAGLVDRIVWNHSRVSVDAGLAGGPLLAVPVGHHGVDGAYAFEALPALARERPELVLAALEPVLGNGVVGSARAVGVDA